MSRFIDEGQELSQADYDWLKARGRVEEALDEWGCTLAEGVGDGEESQISEPIVAMSVERLQGSQPDEAIPPGTLESVHPDQVGFIEGTEDAVTNGGQVGADEEEVPPYEEWDKADLEGEVARRNEDRGEDEQIVVTGTGKSGNVLKSDLVAALEADDAEE